MIRRILSQHHHYTFISVSLLLLLPFSLFLLHPNFLSPPRQHSIPSADELSDFALFNAAVSTPQTYSRIGIHNPTLKIAFLFLTNADLSFATLWARFFNSTTDSYFNVYIHADPDKLVADPGGVFANRFIKAKHTERSSATLISAARRLIATAILDDPLNNYFALVSQSCIPIHSFRYVYETIFNTSGQASAFAFWPIKSRPVFKSFIEILDNEDTLPSRYVARGKNVMLPEVPYSKFRVGSQFFVLKKKHALMVLKERKLWRKFKIPCFTVDDCYPEEHYFSTFLDMEDPNECTKYTVTRVNWTSSVDGHPHLYRPPEVSAELIYTLRGSNFSHDYLFARKFSPDCVQPLMELADTVIFKD